MSWRLGGEKMARKEQGGGDEEGRREREGMDQTPHSDDRTLRRPAVEEWRNGRRMMGSRPYTPPTPSQRPSTPTRPAKSHGPEGSTAASPLPTSGPPNALSILRRRDGSSVRLSVSPRSSAPPFLCLLLISMVCFACGAAAEGWPSNEHHSSHDGDGGSSEETLRNLRITCYTCVNVSSNDECNRFAIDRPCPEGRDYCLTLHVMDGLEMDRSVLVNKRCAYLDECTGDSTGCTTSDGQTQCVSCCDEPYCNDYVPINETSAVFHRSSARGVLVGGREATAGRTCLLAVVLSVSALFASRSHAVT